MTYAERYLDNLNSLKHPVRCFLSDYFRQFEIKLNTLGYNQYHDPLAIGGSNIRLNIEAACSQSVFAKTSFRADSLYIAHGQPACSSTYSHSSTRFSLDESEHEMEVTFGFSIYIYVEKTIYDPQDETLASILSTLESKLETSLEKLIYEKDSKDFYREVEKFLSSED
jgi:hypothetical protein